MNIGTEVAIFCNINTDKFNDQEKGQAIYDVLKMPTHNGISKEKMLSVIDYLLRLSFDLPEQKDKIICASCGKSVETAEINKFDYEGSDYWTSVPLNLAEEDAVYFDTDPNFTGYEMSEEEINDSIRCPACGGSLFHDSEVQVYDITRVVKFLKHESEVNSDDL